MEAAGGVGVLLCICDSGAKVPSVHTSQHQCCGSGYGIRCVLEPWIWDPGWKTIQIREPESYF
jgi:hypothetical protein